MLCLQVCCATAPLCFACRAWIEAALRPRCALRVSLAARCRQVIKSEPGTLRIPELDFEIPANTQKGILSTVEGMLRQVCGGGRPHRRASCRLWRACCARLGEGGKATVYRFRV